MAFLESDQIAHGQHIEISTPNGTVRARGVDPAQVSGDGHPSEVPTRPEIRVESVEVTGTVSPHSTAWFPAWHGAPLPIGAKGPQASELATAFPLLSRTLPPGVLLAGACVEASSGLLLVGFANLTDTAIQVSEQLRLLVLP